MFVYLEILQRELPRGNLPNGKDLVYQSNGLLFVTSENVRQGNLDISKPKYVQLEFNEKIKGSELQEGDLLINLVGASIGRSCLFEGYAGPANVNQAVGVVTLNEPLIAKYLVQLLQTPQGQSFLTRHIVEAARANISLKNLRELAIPVPPLDILRCFSTIIESAEYQKALFNSYIVEMDTLFASLQSQAFSGAL